MPDEPEPYALYRDIKKAVKEKKLGECFTAHICTQALPGYRRTRIATFLAKHREGNPGGYKVLFQRVARKQYRLFPA